jgi:hypothetical protein
LDCDHVAAGHLERAINRPLAALRPSRLAIRPWQVPSLDASTLQSQRQPVSAADIIRELGALPLEEQLKVIAFTKELDKNRELTREEFLQLARRYQNATEPDQVADLEDELMRGFYGPKGHA